jgi:STE24 endopeptidase
MDDANRNSLGGDCVGLEEEREMKKMISAICTALALTLAVFPAAIAAQSEGPDETSNTVARPRIDIPTEIPEAARARPGFDIEEATQAYIDFLSEEQRQKSNAYTNGGYWLQIWSFLYGIAIAWVLLSTRVSAKMRDLSERISRRRPIQTGLYAAQYIVVTSLLAFPLTFYQYFLREHKYEMANQTFGPWMGDQIKGLLVGVVLGSLAMMAVYGAIRKMPRTWWVWGGLIGVAFVAFVMMIFPVFIAPLFNDYQPLEEGPLRDRILSIARANGIPADNVYWFDASRQTTRISANVSGFLGTTRISLNDNLLRHTSPEEVEAVLAHEMAHYLLHLPKLLIYTGLVIIVGFAVVKWGSDKALARWGKRWNIRSIGDNASLPLLIAVFSIYSFLITPIQNSIVRGSETEADIVALNMSGQPDAFARTAMRVSDYRKVKPGPIEEMLWHHHPSGHSRVHMSMVWKSEHLDEERKKGR